jgi:hypothetical protein
VDHFGQSAVGSVAEDADRGCRTNLGGPFAKRAGMNCRRFSFSDPGVFQQKAATNGSHTEALRNIAMSY